MKQSPLRARDVSTHLQRLASPTKAKDYAWFFKTGPGEYGEGDRFMGITVPDLRKTAKLFKDLSVKEAAHLLHSPLHEERLVALFLLIQHFTKGSHELRRDIYNLYLANTKYINNWDLVDASAPQIVGGWLSNQPARTARTALLRLARSPRLWERRIAMVATCHWSKRADPSYALLIAQVLLHDRHDLIQKAVGWMLREVGKHCSKAVLCEFLNTYGLKLGRTSLRYAIEHFPEPERQMYLKQGK